MDRLYWITTTDPTSPQWSQEGVRVYDGGEKTPFDEGLLHLHHSRLVWIDKHDVNCAMALDLALIALVESEAAGMFGRSAKIVLHLEPRAAHQSAPSVSVSVHAFVKLSFRDGGQVEFLRQLEDVLQRRPWEIAPRTGTGTGIRHARSGILGIERRIEREAEQRDSHISKAFEDLKSLMDMARDTVQLTKQISAKLQTVQADKDETLQLKSYLLTLGVRDDPVVTKDEFGGDVFHDKLASEISHLMLEPVRERSGMMTLTDVYCFVNRARGLELVSPDDVLNACKQMQRLQLPTVLRLFASGVAVLQLATNNDMALVEETAKMLADAESLSPEQLAGRIGTSVTLGRERLLLAEQFGKACRDDSAEGLRFYANRFLELQV